MAYYFWGHPIYSRIQCMLCVQCALIDCWAAARNGLKCRHQKNDSRLSVQRYSHVTDRSQVRQQFVITW